MVEGRISGGVVVGDGSDVGGGASIMGTLSGGGKEVIAIGERCLLGANAGIGISLGDDCVVEAGLYVTAGTKVTLADGTRRQGRRALRALGPAAPPRLRHRRRRGPRPQRAPAWSSTPPCTRTTDGTPHDPALGHARRRADGLRRRRQRRPARAPAPRARRRPGVGGERARARGAVPRVPPRPAAATGARRTSPVRSPLVQMAEDTDRVPRAGGRRPRAACVGHSTGALLALTVALRRPDLVPRLRGLGGRCRTSRRLGPGRPRPARRRDAGVLRRVARRGVAGAGPAISRSSPRGSLDTHRHDRRTPGRPRRLPAPRAGDDRATTTTRSPSSTPSPCAPELPPTPQLAVVPGAGHRARWPTSPSCATTSSSTSSPRSGSGRGGPRRRRCARRRR